MKKKNRMEWLYFEGAQGATTFLPSWWYNCHILVNCTIESQMVFYDAANGDESIELVNSSLETNSSSQETESERTDIVEVEFTVLFLAFICYDLINSCNFFYWS